MIAKRKKQVNIFVKILFGLYPERPRIIFVTLKELQKLTEQLAKPLLAIEKGISEKKKILLIKDLQKIQSQIEKLCGKLY